MFANVMQSTFAKVRLASSRTSQRLCTSFANICSGPIRRRNKTDEEEQEHEGGIRRSSTKSKREGDRAQHQGQSSVTSTNLVTWSGDHDRGRTPQRGQRLVTSTKMEHTSTTLVTESGTTIEAEHHRGANVRGPAPGSGTKDQGRAPHWTRNFWTGDHIMPHSND